MPCSFNGAAGVNPRIGGLLNQGNAGIRTFNGAAGVNPRIAARRRGKGRSKCPFNGAAGVNPRIVVLDLSEISGKTFPSMGPRV